MKNQLSTNSIYDTTIRLFIMLLIIAWCLLIMYPFASIILWSLILALAIHPLHKKLSKTMGGKPKLASIIIVLSFLVIFIIPTWFLVGTLVDEVKELKASYHNGTLAIPPPAEKVKQWPVIGEKIYNTWLRASGDVEQFLMKYKDQLVTYGSKIAKGILSAVSGIVQIIISLLIAGVLLAIGGAGEGVHKFFRKVGGDKGDKISDLILKTVGSVVRGILGESLVMALLNGTVFLLAGVPFAGLWTLLAFVFAVLQIPVLIITVSVIIYFFAVKSLMAAIIWSVVLFLVGFSDNFLTPLMLGKGAPVPMVVIFIGVIGGFMTFGFIGLFTGAIVMSVGYTLFIQWINSGNEADQTGPTNG
jgi:predicted PurR-regulated permease PerM